jgi:hypothetical protein
MEALCDFTIEVHLDTPASLAGAILSAAKADLFVSSYQWRGVGPSNPLSGHSQAPSKAGAFRRYHIPYYEYWRYARSSGRVCVPSRNAGSLGESRSTGMEYAFFFND